jgi:hypothetical protein
LAPCPTALLYGYIRYRGIILGRHNDEAAPRQGAAFLLCFSRSRRTQPHLARIQFAYVFDFFLLFFFMTLVLGLALSPNRNNGNRQMNAA